MVSYLDVLTILLILFVVVAAHAVQSKPAAAPASVASAAQPAAPAVASLPAPAPTQDTPPELQPEPEPVEQVLRAQGLDVQREPWGLVISLPQKVLFPSGDERIPASARPVVEEIAKVLRTIPNKVNLAGNSDSVPIHNRRFRNNWELSAARGMALLDLLAGRYGVEESRLSVTSYGSFHPRASNDSPENRAGNRRVEITIVDAQPEATGVE